MSTWYPMVLPPGGPPVTNADEVACMKDGIQILERHHNDDLMRPHAMYLPNPEPTSAGSSNSLRMTSQISSSDDRIVLLTSSRVSSVLFTSSPFRRWMRDVVPVTLSMEKPDTKSWFVKRARGNVQEYQLHCSRSGSVSQRWDFHRYRQRHFVGSSLSCISRRVSSPFSQVRNVPSTSSWATPSAIRIGAREFVPANPTSAR
mmetsp:Transcript_30100/g.80816  ORF Transcript_30100/g.80816 Transcript_30100/m.80816 type:complete len:202 (-) Transcript_30100:448-1053(-)